MTGILSLITYLPLVGVAAILLLRLTGAGNGRREEAAKWIAFATTMATLALSVLLIAQFDPSAMQPRSRLHQREAEALTGAVTGGIESPEAAQRFLAAIGGDAGAVIGNRYHHAAPFPLHPQTNAHAALRIAQGVLDQVAERLAEQFAMDGEGDAFGRFGR